MKMEAYSINIEGIGDTLGLEIPENKAFYDILPEKDVYLPNLYIRHLKYGTHSYSKYYVQYDTESKVLRRVTVYLKRQQIKDFIPLDEKEYQDITVMVNHPRFNEYLEQLFVHQAGDKYLNDFNNAFGLSR